MKKFLLVVFLFAIFIPDVFPQINLNIDASISNTFRYGNGNEYLGSIKKRKEYFEDWADARFKIKDIIFGMRYEISDPIEYGRNFKGIRKRFVEYNNDIGLSVRVGDFWDIVSRGLTFNVFEDRTLAYDTGIDGLRVTYKNTFGKKYPIKVRGQIIGGNMDYSDYLDPNRIETYKIRNFNFDISPIKQVILTGSYTYSEGVIPQQTSSTSITAELPEINFKLNLNNLQFCAVYAHKNVRTAPNSLYPVPISAMGDALYSSLAFNKNKFGVTLEYKNYRFDLTAPDNRASDRPTKMLPFQNPPTAQRVHTSTLISRNPHVVDFNDEVGGQIEFIYVPNDKMTFTLYGSVASRHYQYTPVITSTGTRYDRVERKVNFIPSLKDEFSPFWEMFLENENYVTDKFYYRIGFGRQREVLFNELDPAKSEKISVTTIPIELKYSLSKVYTLKLNFEQQWGNNTFRTEPDYMNQYISLNLTKSPDLGLTVSAEFTNDDEEPTGKKNWFLGEVFYKINQSNTVTVSYGRERGGLKCTSGICRFVNPFEGFRLTIQNQF